MNKIIVYKYIDAELTNEYQTFGDGMNITKVEGNKDNCGRLKAYEGENEVMDIPLINSENQPLDWYVE